MLERAPFRRRDPRRSSRAHLGIETKRRNHKRRNTVTMKMWITGVLVVMTMGIHRGEGYVLGYGTGKSRIFPQTGRRMTPQREGCAVFTMSIGGGKPLKIGICGATGAVGEEILHVLQNRNLPIESINLYASERSAGTVKKTPIGDVKIETFDLEKARKLDVVFLAVGGGFSEKYAKALAEGDGPIVIDNSSAFRYQDDVPLVVPEINAHTMKGKKLISNPNCTTSIAVMALWPLLQKYGIKRCIMSTYQAASGAGAEGMAELSQGVREMAEGKAIENKIFAHPLPFNVIPHIDKFMDNMYTKEEMKVTWETRKIMGQPDLKVSCTAVRIPTLRAHAEAITIETERPCSVDEARDLLSACEGVEVVDDPLGNRYPMPLTATSKFEVEVGRIRQSLVFDDHGLDFFVCGDQLLRGAALNAVLIAEKVFVQDPVTA